MVNRAAIIEDSKVVNVVEAETSFAKAKGWVMTDTAKVGDNYDSETGEFTRPPDPVPPVPTSVSKRQAKEALIRQGKYQQALDTIAAISDPTERLLAQNYWEQSYRFERDNATLNQLAINGLGLTEAELDELFRYAETL